MCFLCVQFVPSFVNKAKLRIKEIDGDLGKMSRVFTNEIQRRDAFHKAISTIKQGVKDRVVGNSTAVCGGGASRLNVVARVTKMYTEYAINMTKVSPPPKFGRRITSADVLVKR